MDRMNGLMVFDADFQQKLESVKRSALVSCRETCFPKSFVANVFGAKVGVFLLCQSFLN